MIEINGGRIRRRDKRVWFVALGVFAAVSLFTFLAKYHGATDNEVEAASLANFDPGYIISDWQMSNYTSMSEAEIQAFLSAKGNCRDTNIGKANNYPHLSYHIKDGHFVCLADEKFGDGINYGDAAPNGDSAAHIIWQAAQDYKINPQVLIVLLQKEQGLITDSWPNNVQYRSATGYGCPDTAACSTKYYGFKNQVRNAASMFRTVLDGGWTNYPLGNNYVQYNPNAACGGSIVNIRSLATSALYRYTPYQPNAGALAAGYGTASCGAYGNRNFYLYFEDWFGGITDETSPIPDSSDIIEGEYVIESKLGSRLVLDIAGGSSVDGANIQLYQFNNSSAQKWFIKKNEDNSYSIINNSRNKVFDVEAGKRFNGTNVQIYSSNNSLAQKWILKPVRTIKDGNYIINSGIMDGKVMGNNNGNIVIQNENPSINQQWKLTYGDDGYYNIVDSESKKDLSVDDVDVDNFTNVLVKEMSDVCKQKWQIVDGGNNMYILYSKCAKFVVDVAGAGITEGTNIQMYAYNGTKAQKWIFRPMEASFDGEYTIVSALDNNMVIDIAGGVIGANNGTNIQLYEVNGTSAQKMQLKKNEDGTYTVINQTTGKVLDVAGGQTINGSNIQLYSSNSSCAQKWKIVENEDKTYSFYSQCAQDMVLDVSGANTNNGANIQLYADNKSLAQKWKLINR